MSYLMFVSIVDLGTGRVLEIEPADLLAFCLELVDRSTEHVVDVVSERPVSRDGAGVVHGSERLYVRVVARDVARAGQLVEERRLAWLGWRRIPPYGGTARQGRLN